MATGHSEPRWQTSPRLALSFHPGKDWNIFFNYGQYYRVPNFRQLYATQASQAAWGYPIQLANPNLPWPRTVSYEIGYNRLMADTYLFGLTGYYQDISHLPGMVSTYNWSKRIRVMNYVSRGYADRRGFEVFLAKRRSEYLTGRIGYEYPVVTGGVVGLDTYHQGLGEYSRGVNGFMDDTETLLNRSHEEKRYARPTFKALIDLHTPFYLGNITGGWGLTIFHLMQTGGKAEIPVYNQGDDYYYYLLNRTTHHETRLRLEKRFGGTRNITLYCIVENPFNRKELFDIGGDETDRELYLDSLKLPVEEGEYRGSDRWGDWDRDYIRLGFMEWYQFMHRRQLTFGARLNIN